MPNYKIMCEKLLKTHIELKKGLVAMARMDKYGDLSQMLWAYFAEFDKIDGQVIPVPKRVKVRRVRKKEK